LAFVLIIGTPERFKCGKQIGSYVGLIPKTFEKKISRRSISATETSSLGSVLAICGALNHAPKFMRQLRVESS
jgi:hypothetical protein